MAPRARPATLVDLLARADRAQLELVAGELVQKVAPTAEHGRGQGATVGSLRRRFDRKPGGRWPGGWWLATETHVHYASGAVFCHDLVGWRRDRVPEYPTGFAVTVRPDWVCEVLSPRNEKRDFVDKPRALHLALVPHYWLLDAQEKLLIVHRWVSRFGRHRARRAVRRGRATGRRPVRRRRRRRVAEPTRARQQRSGGIA